MIFNCPFYQQAFEAQKVALHVQENQHILQKMIWANIIYSWFSNVLPHMLQQKGNKVACKKGTGTCYQGTGISNFRGAPKNWET